MTFRLTDLRTPLIAAPMAGGISTPALVAATARSGGLGFLAAGYQSVEALERQIRDTRTIADLFGVNLFVPSSEPADLVAAHGYRARLLPIADSYGVDLPLPSTDDDGWGDKVDLLLNPSVPVVSFTFGCPPTDVIGRFHRAGASVLVTVTSTSEAEIAVAAGADGLIAQGPGAGGHRATFRCSQRASTQPLQELLVHLASMTALPLIAAGGLTAAADVDVALRASSAVQVGTALLCSTEAGTSEPYRRALCDPTRRETAVTRAFSGRVARGLRNHFIDNFDELAPPVYPAVHQITAPIRRAAAAAGNAEHLSLWAGTGWRHVRATSTREIIDRLFSAPLRDPVEEI